MGGTWHRGRPGGFASIIELPIYLSGWILMWFMAASVAGWLGVILATILVLLLGGGIGLMGKVVGRLARRPSNFEELFIKTLAGCPLVIDLLLFVVAAILRILKLIQH